MYGCWQIYGGATERFARGLRTERLTRTQRRWVMRLGSTGLMARGAVFLGAGWLMILAGLRRGASQAGGLPDVLRELTGTAHGPWLMGAAGVGLLAYGLYQAVKAAFGIVRT